MAYAIGCQDLLSQPNVTHSGQLLKQLTYHKKRSLISSMLAKLPWVNRYVVLCKGHLYHYPNSFSKKPSGSYSLRNYHMIVRVDNSLTKYPWTFKIVHQRSPPMSKYFAAASERELQLWMKEIRKQIAFANTDRGSKAAISEDFSALEEPVYDREKAGEQSSEEDDEDEYIIPVKESDDAFNENPAKFSGNPSATSFPKQAKNVHSKPAKDPLESAQSASELNQVVNNEEVYLDVDTELERRIQKRLEKLKLPKEMSSHGATSDVKAVTKCDTDKSTSDLMSPVTGGAECSAGYSLSKEIPPEGLQSPQSTHFYGLQVPSPPLGQEHLPPKPPPLPPSIQKTTKIKLSLEKEAFWKGTNTRECEKIIRQISQEGVYLLRDSDHCAKTLICFADGQIVKFMIRETEKKKYNIEHTRNFDTIETLLKYYHDNNLPNKSTTLTKPYKKLL